MLWVVPPNDEGNALLFLGSRPQLIRKTYTSPAGPIGALPQAVIPSWMLPITGPVRFELCPNAKRCPHGGSRSRSRKHT